MLDLWTVARHGNVLRCTLSTHPLGWQLQLKMGDGQIPRSQVVETEGEVFDESAQWRGVAIEAGWATTE